MSEKRDIGKWAGRGAAAVGAAAIISSFIEYGRGEDWGPVNEAVAIVFVILTAMLTTLNRKNTTTA